MPERRRSSRDLRDAIIGAVEQFHTSTNAWPTPQQVATSVGRSVNNLRWHVDKLIAAGIVQRVGGTLLLIGHTPPTLTAPECLSSEDIDLLIFEAARAAHARGRDGFRIGHVIGFIIEARSPVIHARMDALVDEGRLIRTDSGYALPE